MFFKQPDIGSNYCTMNKYDELIDLLEKETELSEKLYELELKEHRQKLMREVADLVNEDDFVHNCKLLTKNDEKVSKLINQWDSIKLFLYEHLAVKKNRKINEDVLSFRLEKDAQLEFNTFIEKLIELANRDLKHTELIISGFANTKTELSDMIKEFDEISASKILGFITNANFILHNLKQ